MSRDFRNAFSGLQMGMSLQRSLLFRKGNVRTPSSLPMTTSSIAKRTYPLDFVSRDGRGRNFFFFFLWKTNRRKKSRRVPSGPFTKLAQLVIRLYIRRKKLSLSPHFCLSLFFISFFLFVPDVVLIFNPLRTARIEGVISVQIAFLK